MAGLEHRIMLLITADNLLLYLDAASNRVAYTMLLEQ